MKKPEESLRDFGDRRVHRLAPGDDRLPGFSGVPGGFEPRYIDVLVKPSVLLGVEIRTSPRGC